MRSACQHTHSHVAFTASCPPTDCVPGIPGDNHHTARLDIGAHRLVAAEAPEPSIELQLQNSLLQCRNSSPPTTIGLTPLCASFLIIIAVVCFSHTAPARLARYRLKMCLVGLVLGLTGIISRGALERPLLNHCLALPHAARVQPGEFSGQCFFG